MLSGVQRIREPCANLVLQIIKVLLIELRRRHRPLRFTHLVAQIIDRCANLLDLVVPKLDGIHHRLFGNFLRPRLDHHDRVGRTHHHDVHLAVAHLRVGRVGKKLPIHITHPHRANRTEKRNIRDGQRRRSRINRRHIRIVLRVR